MKKNRMCWGMILSCILLAGCGKSAEENVKMPEEEKEPIVLTYGYIDAYSFMEFDQDIKAKIVDFNRSQDEYYVEIKQYGEDSYVDGLSALNAEIAAGKGPDIIQIDNEQQLQEYAAKNMVVDLYSFMGEESELQKEQFLEKILQQFETDGKMCGLVTHFAIQSTLGNPALLDSEKITFSRLCNLIEENKDNTDIVVYQNMSKEGAISYCIYPEIELFVDLENKTCNFNTEEFKKLVEFSNEYDYSVPLWTHGNEAYVKMQDNELIMIYDGVIPSFNDFLKYKGLFGERAILLGWPTINGSGVGISTNCSRWAINGNSKNQDGAWQFICSLFEDDYMLSDTNLVNGFPVLQEAFDKCAVKAMEPDMGVDAYGNSMEVLLETTFTDQYGVTITYPNYPATEEDVSYIKNIIANVEPVADYSEVESIIYEEVTGYWSGMKSLDAVVDVIQNRVQLYLDEIS